MKRSTFQVFAFVPLAALAAAAVLFFALRGGRRAEPAEPPSRAVPVRRPGAAYEPKAAPLRRAARPAVPAPAAPVPAAAEVPDAAPVPAGDAGGGEGEDARPDEDAGGFADVPAPPDFGDGDPGLAALEPERVFSENVWESLTASWEDLVAEGARGLSSADPDERAFGGILLFFGGALDGELLGAVASDPDLRVPLAVFDWVRDHGTDDQIAAFRAAFDGRGATADELFALAAESGGLVGGGRSALDLFLGRFGEDDVPVDALARLVAAPGASYDVREQAYFKLLEPATRPAGESALRSFADALAPADGGLLPFAAAKLAALAEISNEDGDDEKIWDSEAPVVFFLAQTEGGLQARDLANYLEYALRRDDPEFPPVVEEGTWEFANEFLLAARDRTGEFPPVELDALDRIASSLDRLVEYDPAFNPFETVEDDGPDEEDDDEDDPDEEDDDEDDPDEEDEDADDSDDEDDPDDEEEDDDDSDDDSGDEDDPDEEDEEDDDSDDEDDPDEEDEEDDDLDEGDDEEDDPDEEDGPDAGDPGL